MYYNHKRIEDRENRAAYDSMLEKRKEEKSSCVTQIESLKSIDETIKKRRAEMKESIDLIDQIIAEGGISNTHLFLTAGVVRQPHLNPNRILSQLEKAKNIVTLVSDYLKTKQ